MICICEAGCAERGEGSEALVHGLSHMSDDELIAFGHGRTSSVHEHMVMRFLHSRGALRSGLADEPCDRRVLQNRVLHIQLEVFEVFAGGLGEHSHVLFESVAVFSQNAFVLCSTDNFLTASVASAANSGVFHLESGLAE